MDSRFGVGVIPIDAILEPETIAAFQDNTRPGRWGCIEWTGRCDRDGYGIFTMPNSTRTLRAHRAGWIIQHRRPVPDGLVLDHLCCNQPCVNGDDHLEPVTPEENGRRVHTPPPGWVQVQNKAKWGIRRRRCATPEERRQRLLARRAAVALPSPRLSELGDKVTVLWYVRDEHTQLAKPRQRSYSDRAAAAALLADLEAAS